MLTRIIGTTLIVVAATSGVALAGPIGWDQPYFTYSPGAQHFEDIEWTPLEFAAFSAYGGYFANVRRPRFETPLPQLFIEPQAFGLEDEVRFSANGEPGPTFLPVYPAFASFSTTTSEPNEDVPVPEPGILALIGTGLLVGSRALRRRYRS